VRHQRGAYSKYPANIKNFLWKDPKNQTNGQQGEFRGPHYDGYAIRYSDERIWKPGTPGYKAEYEKKLV